MDNGAGADRTVLCGEEAMSEPLEGEIVNRPPLTRLTKHDENVVLLLETAFHNGYNITEACQHADISRTTFYEWMGDDDVFSYRMSLAQSALNRKAKTNVFEAINQGDPNVSLRWLTLRDPDFKPKAEVTSTAEQSETRDKIRGFLDDIKQHDPSSEPTTTDGPVARGEVPETPTDIS